MANRSDKLNGEQNGYLNNKSDIVDSALKSQPIRCMAVQFDATNAFALRK